MDETFSDATEQILQSCVPQFRPATPKKRDYGAGAQHQHQQHEGTEKTKAKAKETSAQLMVVGASLKKSQYVIPQR